MEKYYEIKCTKKERRERFNWVICSKPMNINKHKKENEKMHTHMHT